MVVEITKMPIWKPIVMFLFYIISHGIIGMILNRKKEQLKGLMNNNELREQVNILDIIFKWYPAGIIILYIIFLYAG